MKTLIKIIICEQCARILGVARRGADRRVKVDVLRAPARDEAELAQAAQYAVVEMEVGAIVCAHCGARYKWILSERAMMDFLARWRGRSFGLDEEAHETIT